MLVLVPALHFCTCAPVRSLLRCLSVEKEKKTVDDSSLVLKVKLGERETNYIDISSVLKARDGVERVKMGGVGQGWFPIACCKYCSTASHHAASSMDIPSGAKAI